MPICHSACGCHPLGTCCEERKHNNLNLNLLAIEEEWRTLQAEYGRSHDEYGKRRDAIELVKRLERFKRGATQHPSLSERASALKVEVGRVALGISQEDIYRASRSKQREVAKVKPMTQDERELEVANRAVERAEAELERARTVRSEVENRRKDYFADGTYLTVETVYDRPVRTHSKHDGEWFIGAAHSTWGRVRQDLDSPNYKVYNVETMREVE